MQLILFAFVDMLIAVVDSVIRPFFPVFRFPSLLHCAALMKVNEAETRVCGCIPSTSFCDSCR